MRRSYINTLRGIAAATVIMTAGAAALCGCGASTGAATEAVEESGQENEAAGEAAQALEGAEEQPEIQAEADATRDPNELVTRELFAMDTYMSISAYGEDAEAALEEAEAEILRLDTLLAAEHDDSEIAQINRDGGGEVSEDTAYLVERAAQIHDETDGAFEISVYPLKELWGFTTEEYRVPSLEEIGQVLPLVGTELIGLTDKEAGAKQITFEKEGVKIDLGGIAKGYTSSRVAQIFEEHSVKGMINLGGNVQLVGKKADGSDWRVAIRKPESEGEIAYSWIDENSEQAAVFAAEDFLGILASNSEAVITSGGYERFFEEDGHIYHHIIDSKTGYPSESDLISATAVSEDGTLADGLSTSIFVMGLDKATEYWRSHSEEFEMIAMNRQGELYATEGLRDRFTSGFEIHWITK